MKQHIRSYITQYPDSIVGFLNVIADILNDLGDEWDGVNKKRWAGIFKSSAEKMRDIGRELDAIRSEYETEAIVSKQPASLITEYRRSILDVIKR